MSQPLYANHHSEHVVCKFAPQGLHFLCELGGLCLVFHQEICMKPEPLTKGQSPIETRQPIQLHGDRVQIRLRRGRAP